MVEEFDFIDSVAVKRAEIKGLSSEARGAYLSIVRAVAKPYRLSLSEEDLVGKVESIFKLVGMEVSCCKAPETINFQMENGRQPVSFVVRDKGDEKLGKYTKPNLNQDLAYVPSLGCFGNYPREIHLNSSLIEKYGKLVVLFQENEFGVRRIVGNGSIKD